MADTIWDDRIEAHEAALESAAWLRRLQATDTWHELPLDIRRTLCKAHGTLESMTRAMVEAELV